MIINELCVSVRSSIASHGSGFVGIWLSPLGRGKTLVGWQWCHGPSDDVSLQLRKHLDRHVVGVRVPWNTKTWWIWLNMYLNKRKAKVFFVKRRKAVPLVNKTRYIRYPSSHSAGYLKLKTRTRSPFDLPEHVLLQFLAKSVNSKNQYYFLRFIKATLGKITFFLVKVAWFTCFPIEPLRTHNVAAV